ncbi:MAG: hypothetical protein KTR30_02480 [Saprospiraceae bacterium]|nr:hypothetical protein [Saprospiraceae bacterium]
MRKSLHDIEHLEAYIQGKLSPAEAQKVQTEILLHPAKYQDWLSQRETYALIQLAGRQQLKTELQAIHLSLTQDPNKWRWWQKIQAFFVD